MPMRKNNFMLPKLDRKYVLDHVSPEEIFAAYFNIPMMEINYATTTGKLIYSAVRTVDERASMGFLQRPDGKLVCRDFGGYFWGDCFDAAGYALCLDSRSPHDFMKILVHIAKTFRIHSFTEGHTTVQGGRKIQVIESHYRTKPVIEMKSRNWERDDGYYWYTKYGINRDILEAHRVYPIQILWVNNNIVYTYKKDDPAYGYYLGQDDDIAIWKIYFPFRKDYRFMTNGAFIQGGHLIKKVENGIITKSLKDVMQIAVFAETFSLQGIAPPSETTLLNVKQMEYLSEHWMYKYTFSDFDLTGVRFGCEMRRRFKTTPIYLTNGRYGTVNFEAKDISDYVNKHGLKQAELLISKYLERGDAIIEDYDFITQDLRHSYVSNG